MIFLSNELLVPCFSFTELEEFFLWILVAKLLSSLKFFGTKHFTWFLLVFCTLGISFSARDLLELFPLDLSAA